MTESSLTFEKLELPDLAAWLDEVFSDYVRHRVEAAGWVWGDGPCSWPRTSVQMRKPL